MRPPPLFPLFLFCVYPASIDKIPLQEVYREQMLKAECLHAVLQLYGKARERLAGGGNLLRRGCLLLRGSGHVSRLLVNLVRDIVDALRRCRRCIAVRLNLAADIDDAHDNRQQDP